VTDAPSAARSRPSSHDQPEWPPSIPTTSPLAGLFSLATLTVTVSDRLMPEASCTMTLSVCGPLSKLLLSNSQV
jgi:hypothetical protein